MARADNSPAQQTQNSKLKTQNSLKAGLPPLLVFLALLALWQFEVLHRLLNIQTFQLPIPSQIAESFARRGADLWAGTWYTLGEAVAGLALGAGLGFGAAAVFTQVPALRRGLRPLAVSRNGIPI